MSEAKDGQNLKIEDMLLPGYPVSFVVLSDDDIHTPGAVALDMFQQVLKPLGDDTQIVYHSIVGTQYGSFDDVSADQKQSGIDRKGQNHMELSALTGGGVHEITDYGNYGTILNMIAEDVALAGQTVQLMCPFRDAVVPVVTFNGNVVDPVNYELQADAKKVKFSPAAFVGYEDVAQIDVVVTY